MTASKEMEQLVAKMMDEMRAQVQAEMIEQQAKLVEEARKIARERLVAEMSGEAPEPAEPKKQGKPKRKRVYMSKAERLEWEATVDWTKHTNRCPKCKRTKTVLPHFGITKNPNGTIKIQPWCAHCRSLYNKRNPR